MGWFAKIAWALGMWICGSCVMSWFGSQIRIASNCAKKILIRIKVFENLFVDALNIRLCSKYLNSVIIKNLVIITLLTVVFLLFVPTIGIVFYFVGMFITWVTTLGAMGLTPNNIEESVNIFLRYSHPGKEDDAKKLLEVITDQINLELAYQTFEKEESNKDKSR